MKLLRGETIAHDRDDDEAAAVDDDESVGQKRTGIVGTPLNTRLLFDNKPTPEYEPYVPCQERQP